MVPNRAGRAGLPGGYEKLLLQLINLQEKKATINIFLLQVDVLNISPTEASFTPILRQPQKGRGRSGYALIVTQHEAQQEPWHHNISNPQHGEVAACGTKEELELGSWPNK
ncbi:hypothetical protein EK904_002683, partial [Melospiza melodia maxima]